MRIFITGITGQLGSDLAELFDSSGTEYSGSGSRELDICDEAAVRRRICGYAPDAVIHCAAFTGVDMAEDEAERCWRVNADGAKNVALACRDSGCRMISISTDYVFPGEGTAPYEVTDPVGPRNVYGRSKLAGELAVRSILPRSAVVRTSWLIGRNGNNFVRTMLKLSETRDELRVVCDQIGSPTFTADLARFLVGLAETESSGVYHMTNEGLCSWAELAESVFAIAGRSTRVIPVTTVEYGARADRPGNSRLSKARAYDEGFAPLPHWKDALAGYLDGIL